MARALVFTLLAAMVGATARAGPREAAVDAGRRHWTVVSGHAGGRARTAATSDARHALRKLRLYARDDAALRVRIIEAPLAVGETATRYAGQILVQPTLRGPRTVDVGGDRYVTALQVCTGAGEARGLRGLRLWGARLRPDGGLAHDLRPVVLAEDGCARWHARVACAPDSVATAVRAWFDRRHGVTGFSLRCDAIER